MSEKKFDPAKPVMTRKGQRVRILCTDALFPEPIVALVYDGGLEKLARYEADGRFDSANPFTESDLINVPEVKLAWAPVWISEDGFVVGESTEVRSEVLDVLRVEPPQLIVRFDLDESGNLTMHKEES